MPAKIAVCTAAMTSPASGHYKAENAIVMRADQRLHKTLCLVDCSGPQHGTHRQLCHTHRDASVLGFTFTQANPSERRVGEHAVGN
jgi:hypothetical protein